MISNEDLIAMYENQGHGHEIAVKLACGGAGRLPEPSELAAPRAQKPADVSEALIQSTCTTVLERDGWRVLRTDPVSDKSRGKGFGELGMADALVMRPIRPAYALGPQCCEVLWIEWKRGNEKAKSHQIVWHRNERARGFITWIANEDFPATVEGFKKKYAASGLLRNKLCLEV